MGWKPSINYADVPTGYDYMTARNMADFIIGPVGSGKTHASLVKPIVIAGEQEPTPGKGAGIRHTRGAVVRNTMPELKTTTIETWKQLWPEDRCGRVVMSSPARVQLSRRGTASMPGIESEILFLALDKPSDVKKLLSLEVTWIYFNEFKEIPRSIVSRAQERVGRYRIAERPTTWSGMWGDTNPPDTNHYLYDWDRVETPQGFKFYHQPPAVLEVNIEKGVPICKEPEYLDQPFAENHYTGRPFDVIPSAGRLWIVNPFAENVDNLKAVNPHKDPLGRESYYGRALSGKTLSEIQCYLQGRYTFLVEGKPVIPEYSDLDMTIEDLPVLKDEPLILGMDVGGGTLQPSAVVLQRHPRGTWLCHAELACFDLGVETFGRMLNELLSTEFPDHWPNNVKVAWGDPAGTTRDEIFETASFDHLKSEWGIPAKPAPTQDPALRIAAVRGPMLRYIDGKPGFLVNKKRCPMLRRGLMGGWNYKRLNISGSDGRYHIKPDKNQYSHVCDALGYALCGSGEIKLFRGKTNKGGRTVIAPVE